LSGPLLAAVSSHYSGGLQPALVLAAVGLGLAGVLVMTSGQSTQGCQAVARTA